MKKYILSEQTPIEEPDIEKWAAWNRDHDRHVDFTIVNDEIKVSTTFLGVDHGFMNTDTPILFETMIFGGQHDQYQERCSTYDEAKKMHATALELVQTALN